MRITQDDIEDIIINELGRMVIILKEDFSECGERSRLARRIMEYRLNRENAEAEVIELIEEEE